MAIELPSFRITARDESGAPLATEDQTLSIIYPQQDFVYASMAFDVEEVPSSVDIEVLGEDEYDIRKVSVLEHPEYTPLGITNTAFRTENFVGEILNNNDYDVEDAVVAVVFRDGDGKLIGGETTFVEEVKANAATPFEISMYESFATENYEIYANIWEY
jgi:hypothetical protein